MSELIVIGALTFWVALIYSSVGHGGASGYLAVLSFFRFPHETMATSALCLNILVAGLAFFIYRKAQYFSWKLTWPFVVASVPAALIGGLIKFSPQAYTLLLAGTLSFASLRLLCPIDQSSGTAERSPSLGMAAILGGLIGLLSGIVGVGGGIFLSPFLILFRWASPKKTAAIAAFFILVNSISGLIGRSLAGSLHLMQGWPWIILAAFFGGILGSRLGAHHFSPAWLRRILAFVLLLAVFKLIHSM